MDQYHLQLAGDAVAQYHALLARATDAGKRDEFVQRYEELFRAISSPQWAFDVGRSIGQTIRPGGFYREWTSKFFYVRYAIFPDAGCGWIYHIDFSSPSWATLQQGVLTMYDMKNMAKLKKLGELAPEAFQAFVAFDKAVFKDGAVPLKYKELIAVAVALTTQCPYCIEIHTKNAKKAGATEAELAETTLVSAALRAGGAVTHGTHTLE